MHAHREQFAAQRNRFEISHRTKPALTRKPARGTATGRQRMPAGASSFRSLTRTSDRLTREKTVRAIPAVILAESFVSFLGLGIQEPQTSLGSLVNSGVAQMEAAPWLLLIPATLLALILAAFNFLGDGLRDYFDARQSP